MKRALKPKITANLAVAPALVTDLSAPAVIGLEPRSYRAFLKSESVPHAIVGRRVVARLDHILAAVDRLAQRQREDAPLDRAVDEDDSPSVDELLSRIGRRRISAGGTR